jgi:hypothetical protein
VTKQERSKINLKITNYEGKQKYKGKGKARPRTGLEGPEGE